MNGNNMLELRTEKKEECFGIPLVAWESLQWMEEDLKPEERTMMAHYEYGLMGRLLKQGKRQEAMRQRKMLVC